MRKRFIDSWIMWSSVVLKAFSWLRSQIFTPGVLFVAWLDCRLMNAVKSCNWIWRVSREGSVEGKCEFRPKYFISGPSLSYYHGRDKFMAISRSLFLSVTFTKHVSSNPSRNKVVAALLRGLRANLFWLNEDLRCRGINSILSLDKFPSRAWFHNKFIYLIRTRRTHKEEVA